MTELTLVSKFAAAGALALALAWVTVMVPYRRRAKMTFPEGLLESSDGQASRMDVANLPPQDLELSRKISGRTYVRGLRAAGVWNPRDDVTLQELGLAMAREETLPPEIRELRAQPQERGSRVREAWVV